jgi:hypothetical protein
VNHSLSAQKLPLQFEQTSEFLEKQKKLFLNILKSSFEGMRELVVACKVTDSFFQKQRYAFIQNDDLFYTRKIFWYTAPSGRLKK